eukprot:jgi/Pico_ML_1/50877/g2007.t2
MGGQGLLMLVLYALSSSSLLVFNKGAVMLIPKPAMLLMLQTSASVAITVALWTVRLIYLEKQKRETLKGYAMVSLLFISTIYANMKDSYAVIESTSLLMFWCCVWVLAFVVDMIFIKHIVDKTGVSGWADAVYIASETWDFKSLLVVGASPHPLATAAKAHAT